MRLTDPRLRVNWVGADGRRGIGISLQCPCCFKCRVSVYFANPLDGGAPYGLKPAPEGATPEMAERFRRYNLRWQRTGDTFETISLMPSVDVSDSGHWHGFITNGEVTGGGPCGSVP